MALLAGAVIAALAASGIVGAAIEVDRTGIVILLMAMSVVVPALTDYARRPLVVITTWELSTILGLMGTVYGFIIALAGITGNVGVESLSGVRTALVTTAVGMVVHVWLIVVREVTRR